MGATSVPTTLLTFRELQMEGPLAEWIHMFRAPKMAHRIALGMALQMFQQLTGANYVSCSQNIAWLTGASLHSYHPTTCHGD